MKLNLGMFKNTGNWRLGDLLDWVLTVRSDRTRIHDVFFSSDRSNNLGFNLRNFWFFNNDTFVF